MKKLIKLFSVTGMSLLMVLSLIVPVSAQEKIGIQKEEIKENFIDMEIDERTAESLVMKLEKGEKLDSFKKEYKNIEPYEIIENDFEIVEKFVYPDGSKKIITIQNTPLSIITGSITGGTRENGTYWYVWKGAKVKASWGIVTASFYADMQGSTGFGRIDRVHTKSISIIGGTFRNESLSITRREATSANPAQAQLYFVGEALNDFGSSTFYLFLRVPYRGSPSAKMQI